MKAIRRMALADGCGLNLQIESVCGRNSVHGLNLLGAIQCNHCLVVDDNYLGRLTTTMLAG